MEFDKESALSSLRGPSTSVLDRRDALSYLLGKKALKEEHCALEVAIAAWERTATSADTSDLDRALAVGEIVRIGASCPPVLATADDALARSLRRPLAVLTSESDGDVRMNVAKALRKVVPGWCRPFVYAALAMEDKSDRIRGEFLAALLSIEDSLASVLSGLAEAFGSTELTGPTAAKAVTRRVARVLGVLREQFAISTLNPGKGVGVSLDSLVRVAVRGQGSRVDEDSAVELSDQVIQMVQTIIRSRFSIAIDPQTFSAVKRASGFFGRGVWPEELYGVLRRLEGDLLEALVLLGRQGVESKALLEQLWVASGSRDVAKEKTKQLIVENPDLPENIKFFLTHWQVRANSGVDSEAVQETVLTQVDATIADALVRADRFMAIAEPNQPVGTALSEMESRAEAISHAAALAALVRELAKRRRIGFFGTRGELMKASQKYFQSESAAVEGEVISPAVVQFRSDGTVGACLIKGSLK